MLQGHVGRWVWHNVVLAALADRKKKFLFLVQCVFAFSMALSPAPLINALLVWPVTLGGKLCLGTFAVVCSCAILLHSQMMDWTAEMYTAWDTVLKPNPQLKLLHSFLCMSAVFFGLHGAVYPPVFSNKSFRRHRILRVNHTDRFCLPII